MPLEPTFLFSILLGAVAVVALLLAVRAASSAAPRDRFRGWALVCVAAAGQLANLVLGYGWVVSLLTTALFLWGAWLLSRARRGPA